MKISVVIPTINNLDIGRTIANFLDELYYLRERNFITDFQLVLAAQTKDNCAYEEFFDVMENYASLKRVRVMYLDKVGKGNALREGLKVAKHEWCLLIDDDLEYPISTLKDMIPHAQRNDIVIASRHVEGGKVVNAPLKRQILSYGYRVLCRMFYGISTSDPQSGMKLVNKKALKNFNFRQEQFVWDTELIYLAETNDLKIKEVPVTYTFKGTRKNFAPQAKGMWKDFRRMI